MKTKRISFLIAIATLPFISLQAAQIDTEYKDVDDYTDFSVNGLSEEKTLGIFESELEDELDRFAKKYLPEGYTLSITFTDIDMAGDIQPWRNRHNADIRYVERIYPPRLAFTYVLKDTETVESVPSAVVTRVSKLDNALAVATTPVLASLTVLSSSKIASAAALVVSAVIVLI